MNKAKVRATFIPNGIGSANKLKYSVFISLDYSSIGSEPSFSDACTFPDFIGGTKFNLFQNGSAITGQQGLSFTCLEAKNLWNLIFNDGSNPSPKLYFKEKVLTFQTNSPLDYIPEPSKIIKYFQSHYAHRILNKSSEKTYFASQLSALQTNINTRPSEIDNVIALIKNIHQNPTDGANTYSRRINAAQEIHISEIISYFCSYPKILRRLGLLYSYEVDSNLITDGAEIQVQLDTSSTQTNTIYEAETPISTVVDKKNNLFIAQTKKPNAYINGLLNLQQTVNSEKRFSVVQNTAVEASYKADAYLNTPNKENVPPLNTNGIYLIDNYRKQEEDDELNSPSKTKLYLEDILTGFRFDLKIVNPKTGEQPSWKSLNTKSSKYEFLKNKEQTQEIEEIKLKVEIEEGWTNTDTKAKTKDKNGVDKEVVADILCHLNGWGLNSKNPLQEEAQKVKSNEKNDKVSPTQGTGDPVHDFLKPKFRVTSKSPISSLHPLRIGLTYQLRARLVTIDGYSISTNEADDFSKDAAKGKPTLRTDDFKFCRLESIGAPVFVLKHSIYDGDECEADKKVKESKRGESEYTLVIRSKSNDSKTSETSERGLAPASISWHLAEWQTAFDSQTEYADTHKLRRSKQFLPQIEKKNGKNYWKERTGKFKANGDTVRKIPYIVDPLSQSFEIHCDENEIYSLLYCDNSDLNFWDENFDWWKIKTWEIVVKEQRKKQTPGTIRGKNCIFSIDSLNKTITILVTKGEDLKFKIRTFPKYDCSTSKSLLEYKLINDHLLAKLIEPSNLASISESNKAAFYEKRKNVFFNSKNSKTVLIREPLLFAEKEFRVVHAVKKPLFNPKFIDKTAIQRTWNPDEISFALLTSTIFYPGKTSKKLEMLASWRDNIDDERSEKPIVKNFENVFIDEYKLNGQIEKPTVTPTGSDNYILGDIEDYGQLIEKSITLTANITVSEFGKLHYCNSNIPITVTIPTGIGNKGRYFIFKNENLGLTTIQPTGTETIDGANNKALNKLDKIQIESDGANWVLRNVPPIYVNVEKLFYAKHNFGDSKHRIVEYKLKATSRFTEFFPTQNDNETSNDEFSVFSESIKLNIPSSQAPSTPKVAFIIPYFEYEFTGNERRRKGNRLRVYLERPWFSSGENEKLAIIISNDPKFSSEKDHYQYVSKWGRDVTTFGKNLLPLTANNFANKLSVANNLTLNNLLFKKKSFDKTNNQITNTIDRPFSAVIFDIQLDTESNCWYADLEFEDVNSYFPFIQLSVARYQKYSIADEELSSSILCDFIQVAPTRTISYHKQGDYIELNLFGSVYKADFDSVANKTVVKNEVYVAFIPKENSQEGNNDILYSLNDDTPNKYDWKKVEKYTLLENGIVWNFKDVSPYDNYTVLVKEFEVFKNSIDEKLNPNPEKNPTKRLTFGDAIEL